MANMKKSDDSKTTLQQENTEYNNYGNHNKSVFFNCLQLYALYWSLNSFRDDIHLFVDPAV